MKTPDLPVEDDSDETAYPVYSEPMEYPMDYIVIRLRHYAATKSPLWNGLRVTLREAAGELERLRMLLAARTAGAQSQLDPKWLDPKLLEDIHQAQMDLALFGVGFVKLTPSGVEYLPAEAFLGYTAPQLTVTQK